MQLPSTVAQLLLVVVAVLPGITYQFVRESRRGPVPGEMEAGHRILRALTASMVLDSLYFAVLGPHLVELLRLESYPARAHDAALHALLLLFAVPALGAALLSQYERRRLRGRYRPTPTAWDHVFRDRGASFIRARLKDGTWVGGWYGCESYATSYPQPAELYLQSTWRMAPDGSFVGRVDGTSGLYLRAEDIDILELLEPPSPPSPRTDRP
ncbi:DUF6338 family protein [Streptomyces sp. NPDC006285]|uniref:DUF6338 family protein n=1 Tax=Streptomyces sp. NPDC006285 TaxID=3364742 RepID=UPI0036CBC7A1